MAQRWTGREVDRPRLLTTVTALRLDRGLGAYELAKRMGLSLREYRELERTPEKMTPNQQERLSYLLDFDPEDFVFRGTGNASKANEWPEFFFMLNLSIGLALLAINLIFK